MDTKSTSRRETIWSLIAVFIAILSLTYCIQAFLGTSSFDTTTLIAKLKMLGEI